MCRILLVDDDRDIRESASALLSLCGHRVDEVENGCKALEWLSSHRDDPPCFAIVDLMMPVMDGWELVTALRRDPTWDPLYIIVFSAATAVREIARAIAANAFWPKPPCVEQFERLRVHCAAHGQVGAPTPQNA
jgi:CheY-like chemotaxis protein